MPRPIHCVLTAGVAALVLASTTVAAQEQDTRSAEQKLQDTRVEIADSDKRLSAQRNTMNSKYPNWNKDYAGNVSKIENALIEGERNLIPLDPGGVGTAKAWVLQRNYELNKKITELKVELVEQRRLLKEQNEIRASSEFSADKQKLDALFKELIGLHGKESDLVLAADTERRGNAAAKKRAERIKKGLQAILVFGIEKAPFQTL